MKENSARNKVYANKSGSSVILVIFSLITMGFSLVTISFITYIESHSGFLTLFMGLIFGWIAAPGGLAVYANLFYLYVLLKVRSENLPIMATIIMLLLASTTFLFDCVPHGAGCSSVYSWGWGAILWGISILSLALAVFSKARGGSKKFELMLLIGLLSVTLVPVATYNFYQMNKANEQEKEKYLRTGVAFTLVELADVPYNPPTKKVTFNKDSVVAIDGQIDVENMRVIDQNFKARIPDTFQHDNIFWRVYPRAVSPQFRYMDGYIALLDEPKPINFHYGIRQVSPQRAEIFITDANRTTLWQTDIIEKNNRYYPSYGQDLFDLFRPILTGNSSDKYIFWNGNDHNKQQFNETTNKHCPFVITKNAEKNTRIIWNKQHIQIDNYYGRIQKEAFCSENYAFLLFVKSFERKDILPALNLIVFDRQTMLPLWHFNKDNRDENLGLTTMLTHYKMHKTLNTIKKVELVPKISAEESPDKKWHHAKVILHTDSGTIVLTRDNYF